MGDPLSPPIAIITCAWYEKLFLDKLNPYFRKFFKPLRYLDDIIAINFSKSSSKPIYKLIESQLQNKCYPFPLKLKATDPNLYLECEITKDTHEIKHFNKNAKFIEKYNKQLFFKLPHFSSYTPVTVKAGTMMGEFSVV